MHAASALAALLLLSISAFADAGVGGRWKFTFQTEGGERYFAPAFEQNGDSVSGKWDKADVAGTFREDRLLLAFPYTAAEANLSGVLKLDGKLTNGALSGNWIFEGYSGTFRAERIETPGSFAGNWDCTVEGDQTHRVTLSLSEAAGVWSGKVVTERGELPMQTVKVENGELTFSVDVRSTSVTFRVKANGDSLGGTWNASGNSGTVKGTRKAA